MNLVACRGFTPLAFFGLSVLLTFGGIQICLIVNGAYVLLRVQVIKKVEYYVWMRLSYNLKNLSINVFFY